MDAGDVAGRGHDAALAATDNQRLVDEVRIVAFFHRGVEGVAIDMGDAEVVEFIMVEEAGAAALTASFCSLRLASQTVTTETGMVV